MRCPYCGQDHPDEAKFCPVSGKIIPIQGFCSKCGNPIEPNWQVCAYCGQPLQRTKPLFVNSLDRTTREKERKHKKKQVGLALLVIIAILIVGLGLLSLTVNIIEPLPLAAVSQYTLLPTEGYTHTPSIPPTPSSTPSPTLPNTPTPTITPFLMSPTPWKEQGILIRDYFSGKISLYDWRADKLIWETHCGSGGLGITKLLNGHFGLPAKNFWLEFDHLGNLVMEHPYPNGWGYLLSDGTYIYQEKCGGGEVFHLDIAGKELWQVSGLHCVQDAYLLDNGNILIADGSSIVREFNHKGDLVWKGFGSKIVWTARRMWNGMTLIGEAGYLELLDENGKLTSIRIGDGNYQELEILPDGNFLAGDRDKGELIIFTLDGSTFWKMTGLDTFTSDYLP